MKEITTRVLEIDYGVAGGRITVTIRNGTLTSVLFKPPNNNDPVTEVFKFLMQHPKDFEELKKKIVYHKENW